MKRIVDDGIPLLAVGIRSLSTPGSKLIRERNLPVVWGHDFDRAEEPGSSGEKDVVAMDVVELAPVGGLPASDFLTAKLIYKCLGYLQETERAG
jgi:hypothetical protein